PPPAAAAPLPKTARRRRGGPPTPRSRYAPRRSIMHVRTVRTRRPCRAATAVASLIAASGAASAADRDWNGPPNADWNTPGFWSPAALPNAADTAWIGRLTQNSVVRITVPPQIGDLRISNGMIVE